MKKEEAKKLINEFLTAMGGTDIYFPDDKEDLIVTVFNCKQITSFVNQIPGWTYSGIHLDPTGKHQYKIDFKKV
jgi:hypothetical protein